MLIAGFIGVEVQRNVWFLLDVRDFMRFRLAKNQKRVLLPNKPDRSRLRCEFGINRGQPDDIFTCQMLLDHLSKSRREIYHTDGPVFIRSATNSATSFTCTESPSALEASLSIVIQNGQPTATVFAPVSLASLKWASLTRIVPFSSSFHICA